MPAEVDLLPADGARGGALSGVEYCGDTVLVEDVEALELRLLGTRDGLQADGTLCQGLRGCLLLALSLGDGLERLIAFNELF
jgi:hypothetical protein